MLGVNYRSPRNIVALSQELIQYNRRRVEKHVTARLDADAQVTVRVMPTLESSVRHVHQEVDRLLALPQRRRIAIIGRKRSQIIPYQIVFASAGIDFCAPEDLNILLSTAFEELKALLVLKAKAAEPLPFGPDPVEGILKLCDKVKRYPLSRKDRGSVRAFLASVKPKSVLHAMEALYHYDGPLKGPNTGSQTAARFYGAIKRLIEAGSVDQAIRAISDEFDGLQKDYGKSLDDIFYADPPFLYLSEFAARYGSDYGAFLGDVQSAISSLAQPPNDASDDSDPVWKRPLHLMTALRAKGKEFDDVFILDCNQGIWPSKLAQSEEELEAERRLFYVAVTRARQSLTLMANDRMFDEVAVPSQYLREMRLLEA